MKKNKYKKMQIIGLLLILLGLFFFMTNTTIDLLSFLLILFGILIEITSFIFAKKTIAVIFSVMQIIAYFLIGISIDFALSDIVNGYAVMLKFFLPNFLIWKPAIIGIIILVLQKYFSENQDNEKEE